jgi:hypothetical protein
MNKIELIDDLIVRSQKAIDDANILNALLFCDEIIGIYHDEVSPIKQKLSKFKYYAGIVEELDYFTDLKILIPVLQNLKCNILSADEKAKRKSTFSII